MRLKFTITAAIRSLTNNFFHSYFSKPKMVPKAIMRSMTTKNIFTTSRTIIQPTITAVESMKPLYPDISITNFKMKNVNCINQPATVNKIPDMPLTIVSQKAYAVLALANQTTITKVDKITKLTRPNLHFERKKDRHLQNPKFNLWANMANISCAGIIPYFCCQKNGVWG